MFLLKCSLQSERGTHIIPEFGIDQFDKVNYTLPDYGNISVHCHAAANAFICLLTLQVDRPMHVNLYGYTLSSIVSASSTVITRIREGKRIMDKVVKLDARAFIITNATDLISIHVPPGILHIELCFVSNRINFRYYTLKKMPPKMKVYWHLMMDKELFRDSIQLEKVIMAVLFYLQKSHCDEWTPLDIPFFHYIKVYQIAIQIMLGYQQPNIVSSQLRQIRMDKHLFYTIFRQLYGVSPTILCMGVRFSQENSIRKENPLINKSTLAFEIGFTSVSNYKRAKYKYLSRC